MKVNSYTICHYGASYIGHSLKSVSPLVDNSFVFYTPHPSHGHKVDIPPIETRDEIMAAIPADQWQKLTWYDTDSFWQEGRQRDYALGVASENASLVVNLDYDEIWPTETLDAVLAHIWQANSARNWLLNFSAHFWRSFSWACKDENWPVRVIDTRHPGGLAYIPKELGPAYHFGYAISDKLMRYKIQIHGHKDEMRPGWLEEKWSAWPPVEDCHPTNGRKDDGTGWWNPEPFDKFALPRFMWGHPYFDKEFIK